MTITIPMPWSRVRSLPDEDQRRSRLLRVLELAIVQTRYARCYDRDAELKDLPRVELTEFLWHPDRYSIGKPDRPKQHRFEYPMGTAPKTAVVGREIRQTWKVRRFRSLWSDHLTRFAPDAIAAPVDTLRAHCTDATPLRNALIPFTDILLGPLAAEDSDRFWNSYQVPIFEQFLGFDGELMAAECEVHHGLHIREEAALFAVDPLGTLEVSFLANPRTPVLRLDTGLSARLITESCPCGDPAPRLVDLKRRAVRRPLAAGQS